MTLAALEPLTTDDAFLGGRVMLLQPKSGYRAGIDAVFLAASVHVPAHATPRILDAGAGVGTVGLCVAGRCPSASIVLVEQAADLARLAKVNIERNSLGSRAVAIEADILALSGAEPGAHLKPESFDHALANPPYFATRRGTLSPDPIKAAANAMPEGDLERWGRFLARMVKPGGTATMIHVAEALPYVLAAFDGRFGALTVLPLHPRQGAVANRVIVQGIKASRAPLTLLPGFVLHADGNAFTPAAQAVLRDGAPLAVRGLPPQV